MDKCDYCNSRILFGGVKDEEYRFCNNKCHHKGRALIIANQIPQGVLMQHVHHIHNGPCPQCNKDRGPVDVHTSHKIWSFVLLTSWASTPKISCRPCGVKNQSLSLLSSFFLGWWGFPWGILMTPVQVVKNIVALASGAKNREPSENLVQAIKLNLANAILQEQAADKLASKQ